MDADSGIPVPSERFGDVAIELELLKPEQVDELVAKQKHYRDIGFPKRIDEIAVELGVLAQVDCDYILRELRKRRVKPGEVTAAGEEELVPPCKLGQFEVAQRIPQLKGVVYKAFDTRKHIPVAVRLLPGFLRLDKKWMENFQREARAAAKLSHPNLAAFYGSGEAAGRLYLSIEPVEGELLSDRLARELILPERDALRLARDLAFGLYHTHVISFPIREVRPEIVLLDYSGHAKLTDLGVCKTLSDDQRLIDTGLAVESLHYLAPEQLDGELKSKKHSDLYGLGATMYHMLTGRPPFDGTPDELREMIANTPTPDPGVINSRLAPETRDLVQRLMAKDPAERPKRADDVTAEIDALLASGKIRSGKMLVRAEGSAGVVEKRATPAAGVRRPIALQSAPPPAKEEQDHVATEMGAEPVVDPSSEPLDLDLA